MKKAKHFIKTFSNATNLVIKNLYLNTALLYVNSISFEPKLKCLLLLLKPMKHYHKRKNLKSKQLLLTLPESKWNENLFFLTVSLVIFLALTDSR